MSVCALVGVLGCRGEPAAPVHTVTRPIFDVAVDAAPLDVGAEVSAVEAGASPSALPAVTEIAKLDSQPESFAVTEKGVVWVTSTGDPKLFVRRVPVGAALAEDVASEARGPGALRVEGNDVAWFSDQGHVIGWSRDGDKPRRVQIPAGRAIADVMVHDGALHYLTHLPAKSETWGKDGTLTRVALDTGTSSVLASGMPGPTALGADATSLFWWNRGDGKLHALTSGKDSVVWSEAPSSAGVGLEGWQPSNDAMRPSRFLYIDAETFWFVDTFGAQLELSRKTGVRRPVAQAAQLVDAKWIYWIDGATKIGRRLRGGGPIQTLVQETSSESLASPPPIEHVAVAGGHLYWVTQTGSWSHRVWSIVLPP